MTHRLAADDRASVTTIVFDVIGTVVNEGSIAEHLASVLDPGVADAVARRWAQAMDRRLEEIREGRAQWRSSEDIRREALPEALADLGPVGPDRLAWLANAGHRLRPWPDSSAALRALGGRFTLVAHAWDLRAAASHGLRTAFVARPGADHPREDDRFDLLVDDLGILAGLLTDARRA